MIAFARAVAEHLSALRGTPWHARPSPHDAERMAEIVRFDGATLRLRIDGARIKVTARFPYGHEPMGYVQRGKRREWTRIPFTSCVSIDRDPRLVARHLVRVLVERYEAAWADAAKSNARERRRDAEDEAYLAELARVGGGHVAGGPGTGRDAVAVVGHLTVRAVGDGEAEVRGVVPREVALRVAGMLRR